MKIRCPNAKVKFGTKYATAKAYHRLHTQSNLISSNTDSSFTMDDSNRL